MKGVSWISNGFHGPRSPARRRSLINSLHVSSAPLHFRVIETLLQWSESSIPRPPAPSLLLSRLQRQIVYPRLLLSRNHANNCVLHAVTPVYQINIFIPLENAVVDIIAVLVVQAGECDIMSVSACFLESAGCIIAKLSSLWRKLNSKRGVKSSLWTSFNSVIGMIYLQDGRDFVGGLGDASRRRL